MLSLGRLQFVSNVPDLAEKLNPENSKIESLKEINLNDTATHVLFQIGIIKMIPLTLVVA